MRWRETCRSFPAPPAKPSIPTRTTCTCWGWPWLPARSRAMCPTSSNTWRRPGRSGRPVRGCFRLATASWSASSSCSTGWAVVGQCACIGTRRRGGPTPRSPSASCRRAVGRRCTRARLSGARGLRPPAHRPRLFEQLSFFSPIALPEAGGELVVYHLDFHDPSRPLNEQGTLDNDVVLETVSNEVVHLSPGDLVVFAGGRWYHRVSVVQGDHIRRTIGGFLGFTSDHRTSSTGADAPTRLLLPTYRRFGPHR